MIALTGPSIPFCSPAKTYFQSDQIDDINRQIRACHRESGAGGGETRPPPAWFSRYDFVRLRDELAEVALALARTVAPD